MINPVNVDRLAEVLVRSAADHMESNNASRVSHKMHLMGMCEAVWAIGYGESAYGIERAVSDVLGYDPRPPAEAATERAEWEARMAEQLASVLAGIWTGA